jgi:hypothetical protein
MACPEISFRVTSIASGKSEMKVKPAHGAVERKE